MSALTVRLSDEVANEITSRAKQLHISRSEYVRKSIENMNRKLQEQERKTRLAKISKLVREDSMDINHEFSRIEHEPKS